MKETSFFKQSKLVRKQEIKGLFYILPFFIGFIAFILYPMIQSVYFSFNELKFDGGVSLKFVGLNNFKRAFLVDTEFRELLLNSVSDMLINVPIILIFSMLIAVFLNGNFSGQPAFQIIFFIPVIISSGIMPALFGNDQIRSRIINATSMTGESASLFDTTAISNLLLQINLNDKFVSYIMYAITNILDVLNSSGIQILVFLMALKAIPRSLYEASRVEGATAWEEFWKITFPMVLPHLLVNVVYTIIDAFANTQNAVMKSITDLNFSKFQFGYAASIAWVYFSIVIIVLILFVVFIDFLTRHYE